MDVEIHVNYADTCMRFQCGWLDLHWKSDQRHPKMLNSWKSIFAYYMWRILFIMSVEFPLWFKRDALYNFEMKKEWYIWTQTPAQATKVYFFVCLPKLWAKSRSHVALLYCTAKIVIKWFKYHRIVLDLVRPHLLVFLDQLLTLIAVINVDKIVKFNLICYKMSTFVSLLALQ